MAVWQMPLVLVPRSNWYAAAVKPRLPIYDGHDELWRSESAREWEVRLREALGEPRGVHGTHCTWGDDKVHDVSFSLDDDDVHIAHIVLRIDVRAMDGELVVKVIEIARRNGLLFLTANGAPVEPSLEAVAVAVRASSTAARIRDPIGFFRSRE